MANTITIDGILYEQKTPGGPFEPIKPVQKAEDTLPYRLWFASPGLDGYEFDERYQFTESQGEAVAAAIRALMDYIQLIDSDPDVAESYLIHQLEPAAQKARIAVQSKGKEVRG